MAASCSTVATVARLGANRVQIARTARSAPQRQTRFGAPLPQKRAGLKPVAALDIDWSDPDTLVAVAGGILGLAVGIGAPIFYSLRDERDEERLEELRALNRATFKETGEYMTTDEIKEIRPPRWTDRREFVDDD